MRYYILNHEIKLSKHDSEYYHVNICNELLEEFYTYVYLTHHNKKIHNSQHWMDVLTHPGGIVLTDLKIKKGQLINADSITKAEVDEIFETKSDMYEHISQLIQKTSPIHGLFDI